VHLGFGRHQLGEDAAEAERLGAQGRALRDAILPAVMKVAANSKQATAGYRYHIDWDASITA